MAVEATPTDGATDSLAVEEENMKNWIKLRLLQRVWILMMMAQIYRRYSLNEYQLLYDFF